jgi:hypothetical protein
LYSNKILHHIKKCYNKNIKLKAKQILTTIKKTRQQKVAKIKGQQKTFALLKAQGKVTTLSFF